MCEKRPVPPERDGSDKEDQAGVNDPSAVRRHVAAEISRRFPGIVNHDVVLRHAARITRDLAGAEDARQNAYLGLLRLSDEALANIRDWDAYIAVCVRNAAVRWRERYSSLKFVGLEAAALEQKEGEDFTARIADEDELNYMLRQLPKNCREAFVWYFGNGLSAAEVAARLGISVAAVKKRLRRALEKMAVAGRVYRKRWKR